MPATATWTPTTRRRESGGTGTSGPAWAGDSAGRNESASPVGVTKLPANSLDAPVPARLTVQLLTVGLRRTLHHQRSRVTPDSTVDASRYPPPLTIVVAVGLDPGGALVVLVVALAVLGTGAGRELSVREDRRAGARSRDRGGACGLDRLLAGERRRVHAALLSAGNCCSSVEPDRASVDESPPDTACITWSK